MNGDEPGTELMAQPTDQPRALIDVNRAVDEWKLYLELTERLLDKSDYQKIGTNKFKKKSAWRKYAKAFNISAEIIKEEVERGPDGYPIYARVWVRAEEPSGRYQVADQECHALEKCCPVGRGDGCTKSHKHCVPNCDGHIHFSHPGDITATAVTRAKNRAISDLIGAGEVSYEEAEGGRATGDRPPRTARAPEPAEPAHDAPEPPAEPKAATKPAAKRGTLKVRAVCGLCEFLMPVGTKVILASVVDDVEHYTHQEGECPEQPGEAPEPEDEPPPDAGE